MCGIVGFLNWPGARDLLPQAIQREAHRGPDGRGEYHDDEHGLHLGHLRLSVLDLSETGSQPMVSHDGRWVMVYNGEIYNFAEIKKELGARAWRGHSDTEVLLEALASWGVEKTLKRAEGMFALALWDNRTHSLTLARDRFGEKPLYVVQHGKGLAFASELKAITAFFPHRIHADALHGYMERGYVRGPQGIFENTWRLPAGTWITLKGQNPIFRLDDVKSFWPFDPHGSVFQGSEANAVQRLGELLDAAVKKLLVADVPVGAFLSGGVDSSLVVESMVRASRGEVRTFSLGIKDQKTDEAAWAKRLAAHWGTRHHELYVSADTVRDLFAKVIPCYDEPFADPSQVPTWLVSQLARQHVTVALSGDAGDEIFAGYANYRRLVAIRQLSTVWTQPFWKKVLKASGPLRLLDYVRGPYAAHRLRRGVEVASAEDWQTAFSLLSSQGGGEAVLKSKPMVELPWERQDLKAAQWDDVRGYLCDDILVKVDRASMAHSLEVRVPFLDPALFTFGWSLPESGMGKRIPKKLLAERVPENLVKRPKSGFGLPLQQWLRHDLNAFMRETLAPARLHASGHLDADVVQGWIRDHEAGRKDKKHALWNALCFQLWWEKLE